MSLSIESNQKHYASFGRCQNVKTGETRCAMTSEDCEPARNDDGERWFNDLRLQQKGIDDGPCKCENTLMGACVSVGGKRMNYECAPRTKTVENDYCQPQNNEDGDSIIPSYEILPTNTAGTNCYCDALQSIEDDSIRKSPSSLTKYGACYNGSVDDFFCAYSSDYCTGDHTWVHPSDVPSIRSDGGYCTCEQTHIGGCVGGMYSFHCALSSDDCHWNTFVLPIDLKVQHNHACMLCEKTITLDPQPDEIAAIDFDPSAAPGLSLVAGISIGAAVTGVALALCGIVRYRVRKDKASNDNVDDSSPEEVPQIS